MTADMRPVILIVDDMSDNLMLLNGLLKEIYRTKIANKGERAIALAQAEPRPDLILLDVMMPDMDGYAVCRALKAERHTADIPVIFLTGKAEASDEALGFAAGCVDYISKPVSPVLLNARIHTHLENHRVRRLALSAASEECSRLLLHMLAIEHWVDASCDSATQAMARIEAAVQGLSLLPALNSMLAPAATPADWRQSIDLALVEKLLIHRPTLAKMLASMSETLPTRLG